MGGPLSNQIDWKESMNGVTIDCSLDVAVHPAKSSTILLIIPGVDGSVDGYEGKDIRMVEAFQQKHDVAAVRIANPFITSHHWESNPRRALEYIKSNQDKITGQNGKAKIVVVAHSAGAAIIAKIAHEYPEIGAILLINPAKKLLSSSDMINALGTLKSSTMVVFGGKDPSVGMASDLRGAGIAVQTIEGADHNFSGKYLDDFVNLPTRMLHA